VVFHTLYYQTSANRLIRQSGMSYVLNDLDGSTVRLVKIVEVICSQLLNKAYIRKVSVPNNSEANSSNSVVPPNGRHVSYRPDRF